MWSQDTRDASETRFIGITTRAAQNRTCLKGPWLAHSERALASAATRAASMAAVMMCKDFGSAGLRVLPLPAAAAGGAALPLRYHDIEPL